MVISSRAYPHPVLAHFSDDIVDSAFAGLVNVATTKSAYILHAKFKTSNSGLLALIEKSKAVYALHVECTTTRYRSLLKSAKEQCSFEIPAQEIDGNVQVCSLILAAEPLPEYWNSGFHPDFGERRFPVRSGDVLAVGEDSWFPADKKGDPLGGPASIFLIRRAPEKDAKAIHVLTGEAKIEILLSQENYEAYERLKHEPGYQPMLNAAIVAPALGAVLEQLRSGQLEREFLSEKRWFRGLQPKLKTLGVDALDASTFPDSTLALAHDLLGNPLTDGLRRLLPSNEGDE